MLCCAESCKASACIFSEFRVFFEFAAMRRMMNSGHQCYENLCRTHAFFFPKQRYEWKQHNNSSRGGATHPHQGEVGGGSSKPKAEGPMSNGNKREVFFFFHFLHFVPSILSSLQRCWSDLGRTRACNPRLRGPMPYPLGHEAAASFFLRYHLGSCDGRRQTLLNYSTCCWAFCFFFVFTFQML